MTSQSPSTNWTKRISGAISSRRAKPAFRPRAMVNGWDISSSTTMAPSDLASSRLPSVEPEST